MMLNRVIYIIIINLLLSLSGFGQKIYFLNGENGTFETSKIYVIENSYCEVIDSIVTNERSCSFCVSDNDSLLYNMELIAIPNANGDDSAGISIYKYHTDGSFIENVVFEYETGHYVDNIIYKNADTLLVTGGRGYTIVDLKNNTFNHILTIPQISFPHDITFYRDRAFVLDLFADRVVSFDFEQNLFFNDPSWSFINPIASRYTTSSVSMLGDCGSPQDFVIYKRQSENRIFSDELHYTSSPDFVTDVICKVGSRINSDEVVRAIPYPLILDLDNSVDYCESNDTIVSLTLCSDNTINLDVLHPYLEEYDDHIDSMTIDIVDGPAAASIDYSLGRLDKNTVGPRSLVLFNSGSSTIQDFTDAITSLDIQNIPADITSRIEIEFQLFSFIRQSLPATVVLEITQEDTYAGRDTTLTFCPDETAVDLNDFLDMEATSGIWPTGNIYDPSTATLSDVLYIVEGQICPNDTAVYSIELYPEASLQSEVISLCEGDSILYQGLYYNQSIDIVDTTTSVVTGCDSLYRNVAIRTSDMPLQLQLDTTICDGGSIDFNGQALSTPGMYRDTLLNSAACDSIIIALTLAIELSSTEIDIDTVLCRGSSLQIDNIVITQDTIVQWTVANIQGCDSLQYNVSASFISPIEIIIDTLLCEGEVLTIQGQSYTEATVDQLFIKDTEGCDSLILNVILNYEERLQLPDQEIEVLRSIPTQIDVAYDENYQSVMWDSVDGLSCTDCLDPIVALDQDVTYQLTVTHADGCDEIIDVRFRVIEEIIIAEEDIYLPNVINLNDPSNNRLFLQSSPDIEISYSLFVYDRWGNQVFESENINSNDASQGWDGSYDGDFGLTQGVYIYKVVTASEEVIYGDILILR